MTARDTVVDALSALYGLAHTREGFRAGHAYVAREAHPAWHSLLCGVRVALSALDASASARPLALAV